MIRWSYVLPRLAVLAAGALFVAFGLDPLIRWGLFWGGQKMLGAKVEIAAVRTSLPRGRIRLQGLQVANPKAPLKNLFQAEQLLLDFDANALLRRRLVVDQAYVSGLKIDGERTESGELPAGTLGRPEAASPFDSLGFDADWTRRFSVQVLKDASKDYRSGKVVDQLQREWQQRYADWSQRVLDLNRQVGALRGLYQDVDRRDPLKIVEAIQRAQTEISRFQMQMEGLRREILEIEQQAAKDFQRLDAARQHDVQMVRKQLRLDTFRATELSAFFLRQQLSHRLEGLTAWVQRGRQIASVAAEPEPVRCRGKDFLFAEVKEYPTVLIRALRGSGIAEWEGKSAPFVVQATDISTHPRRHDQPTRIRLAARGDVQVTLRGVLDFRGETAVQRFTVNCPKIAVGRQVLGKVETVALMIDPCPLHLWSDLEIRDGTVRGKVILRQEGLRITPRAAGQWGERIERSLATALSQVRQMHTVVEIAGPLARPLWTLQSNLGGQVATALNSALLEEVEHQRQRLERELNKQIAKETQRLQAAIDKQQDELLAKLKLNDQTLEELKQLAPKLQVGQLRLPALDRLFK